MWIVTQSAYQQLMSVSEGAVRDKFGPGTIIIGTNSGPGGATYVRSRKTFDAVTLDTAGTVMYDLEGWPDSPQVEQQDPVGFMRAASQWLHCRRQLLLAAPANDLILRQDDYVSKAGTIYRQFLEKRWPCQIGAWADLYVAQSQGLQQDPAEFTNYVQQAAYQVNTANPYCTVYAGLSTRFGQSGGELRDLYEATVLHTVGCWLNVPTNTDPRPMTDFLKSIA